MWTNWLIIHLKLRGRKVSNWSQVFFFTPAISVHHWEIIQLPLNGQICFLKNFSTKAIWKKLKILRFLWCVTEQPLMLQVVKQDSFNLLLCLFSHNLPQFVLISQIYNLLPDTKISKNGKHAQIRNKNKGRKKTNWTPNWKHLDWTKWNQI